MLQHLHPRKSRWKARKLRRIRRTLINQTRSRPGAHLAISAFDAIAARLNTELSLLIPLTPTTADQTIHRHQLMPRSVLSEPLAIAEIPSISATTNIRRQVSRFWKFSLTPTGTHFVISGVYTTQPVVVVPIFVAHNQNNNNDDDDEMFGSEEEDFDDSDVS